MIEPLESRIAPATITVLKLAPHLATQGELAPGNVPVTVVDEGAPADAPDAAAEVVATGVTPIVAAAVVTPTPASKIASLVEATTLPAPDAGFAAATVAGPAAPLAPNAGVLSLERGSEAVLQNPR